MKRPHFHTGCLAMGLLSFLFGCGDNESTNAGAKSKYQPGQVWTYHTRPGEEDSRVVILHVDADPKMGNIIHVYVDQLSIPSPTAPDGISREVGHMPLLEEAVDKSVVNVEGTRPIPDFQEGYQHWRQAYDEGNAGAFSLTVSEAIEHIAQAIQNPQP